MNQLFTLPLLFAVGILTFGCEKKADAPVIDITKTPAAPTETLETKKLGGFIDQYVTTPSAENAARVQRAFADLDGEIAELQERVTQTNGNDRAEAQAKLDNLLTYRNAETARFAAATSTLPVTTMTPVRPVDTRTGAEKLGDSVEKAANGIQDTAKKIGNSVEKGAENAGDKVQDATE
ncbi:MAG TPA: hypothetical protein VF585_01185 [Chthoniobacterales bacterium]|jgi:phage-related tail protein